MNTGIGDAINLAWKLAAVLAGRAPDTPARQLRGRADRLRPAAGRDHRPRLHLRHRRRPHRRYPAHPHRAAADSRAASRFEAVREFMFRTVSQIMLNYRGGPLSRGAAGHVHGGDRLPWVAADGADNFAPLASDGLAGPCLRRGQRRARRMVRGAATSRCSVFAWRSEHETAGLARDALYLLRPDTYVALADGRRHGRCARPLFRRSRHPAWRRSAQRR